MVTLDGSLELTAKQKRGLRITRDLRQLSLPKTAASEGRKRLFMTTCRFDKNNYFFKNFPFKLRYISNLEKKKPFIRQAKDIEQCFYLWL